MKTLIIPVLMLCALFANAQKVKLPLIDSVVVYTKTIDRAGIDKQSLYTASQQWFVDAFKNAKDVIQSQDASAGSIIGKGKADAVFSFSGQQMNGLLYWTIKIDVKDNKFRYKLYDIKFSMGTDDIIQIERGYLPYLNNVTGQDQMEDLYKTVNFKMSDIEQSLIAAISKAKKDDF